MIFPKMDCCLVFFCFHSLSWIHIVTAALVALFVCVRVREWGAFCCFQLVAWALIVVTFRLEWLHGEPRKIYIMITHQLCRAIAAVLWLVSLVGAPTPWSLSYFPCKWTVCESTPYQTTSKWQKLSRFFSTI